MGDATFGAGAGAGAGAAGVEAQPPKSSLLNRSAGIAAAGFEAGLDIGAGLGAGGEAGVAFCVKEKSRPLLSFRGTVTGLGAGGWVVVGVISKKLPPLRGGGDVTCGAIAVALVGIAVGNPLMPPNAEGGTERVGT